MIAARPRRLLWRLCLALIAIQLLAAFGLGWFAFERIRTAHHEQAMLELRRLLPLLADRYASDVTQWQSALLRSKVEADGSNLRVRITLINPQTGVVLADSARPAHEMDNHLDRPEVQQALSEPLGTEIRYSTSVNSNMIYLAQLFGEAEEAFIVRAALPLAHVDADARRVLGLLGAVGGLSLLLTVGLFYGATRAFSDKSMRQLESMRSDFAANVSHELRTPITNIKGYVETMLDVGVRDEKQTIQFLETIKRNADRLGAIIEDILSLAWLEQPDTKAVLKLASVSVPRIIGSVASQFESAAEAKSIRIEAHAPGGLEAVVDSALIEQALANFVSNAIKYSPSGTVVKISAERSVDGMIRISVEDQGPGIAADHLPRVFERFYRVDRARSRELGGTGLGLAIVKHIALVHGGRVEAQSTVGKGSTFTLVLP